MSKLLLRGIIYVYIYGVHVESLLKATWLCIRSSVGGYMGVFINWGSSQRFQIPKVSGSTCFRI